MAALVETMFSVREKPWHGLGTIVSEAPDSQKALELAGLDWNVIQKDIITSDESSVIPGFKANVRDTDNSVLGIVTDRYKVVQNSEAFAFTDEERNFRPCNFKSERSDSVQPVSGRSRYNAIYNSVFKCKKDCGL